MLSIPVFCASLFFAGMDKGAGTYSRAEAKAWERHAETEGGMGETGWAEVVLPLLPKGAATALKKCPLEQVLEVRLRVHQPMEVVLRGESRLFFGPNGQGMLLPNETQPLLGAFCGQAVYAWEKELGEGFVTLPQGCRVGVTGRIGGKEGLPSPVTGFCIRMGRSVKGCALPILPRLLEGGRLLSTLLFSPPGGGKTTLLRDIVRLVSRGEGGSVGERVGLVDERYEVSGAPLGEGGFDLGPRTDVLGGHCKGQGLLRMLSTMGPQVLAADELNFREDVEGVLEACRRGVTVLCTAHGGSFQGLLRRRGMETLGAEGVFDRFVLVEEAGKRIRVFDGAGKELP